MAITVIREASQYMPVFNPIPYGVLSDNVAQPNFKYVADVYDAASGLIARLKIPQAPDTYGYFDVHRVLESLVTKNFALAVYGFQECAESIARYSINFGEEYGTDPVVYPDLTNVTGKYVWNGALDEINWRQYQATGEVNSNALQITNAVTGAQFLTRMPSDAKVRIDEDAFLYMGVATAAACRWMYVSTYNSAGTNLQNVLIANPSSGMSTTTQRMLSINVGPNGLNGIDAGYLSGGSQPIISNSVAYYDVLIRRAGPIVTTLTQRFTIDSTCTIQNFIRLHWLNPFGGYDSFTFLLRSEMSMDAGRSFYQKIAQTNGSGAQTFAQSDRGNIQFDTKGTTKLKCMSNWLTDDEAIWLRDLFLSSDVIMQTAPLGYGGSFNATDIWAVQVKNPNFVIHEKVNEPLFTLDFDLEFSLTNIRQRW